MLKGSLKDRCPACGVPAKMFEPYAEKVSEHRKMLLSLDIHPILVHFPVSFNVTILVLSAASLILKGAALSSLEPALTVLVYFLPIAVIAAFLGGLFDGKVRFRKVTTPILLRKIIYGSLFFLLAASMVMINIIYGPVQEGLYFTLILSAGGVAVSTVLGKYGVSLLNAKFPG